MCPLNTLNILTLLWWIYLLRIRLGSLDIFSYLKWRIWKIIATCYIIWSWYILVLNNNCDLCYLLTQICVLIYFCLLSLHFVLLSFLFQSDPRILIRFKQYKYNTIYNKILIKQLFYILFLLFYYFIIFNSFIKLLIMILPFRSTRYL